MLVDAISSRALPEPAGNEDAGGSWPDRPASIGRVVPPGGYAPGRRRAQAVARSGADRRAVLLPGCSSERLIIVPVIALPTWSSFPHLQADSSPWWARPRRWQLVWSIDCRAPRLHLDLVNSLPVFRRYRTHSGQLLAGA